MSADTPARRIAARHGVPKLAAHLGGAYGTEVTEIDQLDLGVYRVDRADGPSWVARLFPDVRPRALVDGDAEILRWLEHMDYPAERLATPEPVSVLDGQPLLVTAYVPPVPRYERPRSRRRGLASPRRRRPAGRGRRVAGTGDGGGRRGVGSRPPPL